MFSFVKAELGELGQTNGEYIKKVFLTMMLDKIYSDVKVLVFISAVWP